jgi:transposase
MPSITRQTIGKYTYLYESTSFRDEQGRPRNRKEKIGKVDPRTGRTVYTPVYLEKMRTAGTPIVVPETLEQILDDLPNRLSRALEGLRDYGVYYFLKHIAQRIKLLYSLEEVFPSYWMEISMLAFYLIATDRPVMYCADWIVENESFPVGSMDSRRISELFSAFGQKERSAFFRRWIGQLDSQEYMALDITSLSSYSGLRNECEWGYNRDGEDLPQINLCMLFGEDTQLPVYQTLYSGSLKDVTTFKTTMEELSAISGGKPLILVMDKGFYSAKNLKMLLEMYSGSEFLLSVPFTNTFVRELVEQERDRIDCANNIILTSTAPIRGVCRRISWGDKHILNAHILYNPERELKERNDLYAHIAWLKEQVETGKTPKPYQQEIEKYLSIVPAKDKKERPVVTFRQDSIEKELSTCGWVVIVGNGDISVQQAHDIYRKKDVVEKSFMRYKNNLGLRSLRVHNDERVQNKLFISFIALIIISYIHRVMNEKDLYRKMTMEKLFLTLAKLKIIAIDGQNILRPLTKEQAEIFSAFSIPLPLVG